MNTRNRKPSIQTIRVLQAMLDSDKLLCGIDLINDLGIASGTLYPILMRLESKKLVKSKWEKADPKKIGRPRKRLYEITGAGRTVLQDALLDLADGSPLSTEGI